MQICCIKMKMTIIFITLVSAQTDLRQQHCHCLCLGTTQCCKTGFQIGTERDTHKMSRNIKWEGVFQAEQGLIIRFKIFTLMLFWYLELDDMKICLFTIYRFWKVASMMGLFLLRYRLDLFLIWVTRKDNPIDSVVNHINLNLSLPDFILPWKEHKLVTSFIQATWLGRVRRKKWSQHLSLLLKCLSLPCCWPVMIDAPVSTNESCGPVTTDQWQARKLIPPSSHLISFDQLCSNWW